MNVGKGTPGFYLILSPTRARASTSTSLEPLKALSWTNVEIKVIKMFVVCNKCQIYIKPVCLFETQTLRFRFIMEHFTDKVKVLKKVQI